MKKAIIKAVAAAAVVLFGSSSAYAVRAYPGIMQLTQPDGTTLNVRLMGDEYHHFYTSEDNYMIVPSDGYYYFADYDARRGEVVPSSHRAVNVSERSASVNRFLQNLPVNDINQAMNMARVDAVEMMAATGSSSGPSKEAPGTFSGTNFPCTGSPKVLIALVDFPDRPFTVENPKDFFTRMFKERGFSDYFGTGCVEEYFSDTSMGQFTPEMVIAGPVTAANGYAYYGGNDSWGSDKNVRELVVEVAGLINPEVDYSQFDTDGDGLIDNIFIIYAGLGEATSTDANTIWPHSAGVSSTLSFDGKKLRHYACSNEWIGEFTSGRPNGIGTFCHEFSHCMGLPDLYCTSYATPAPFTPGEWDIMDAGPYNNNGFTPPFYSGYERYCMGWLTPTELSDPRNVVLNPIYSSNEACIIKTNKKNEFFILENRQRVSWDKYIPAHGMLIWHIDFNQTRWDSNSVSNSVTHQYVDIEEADNIKTSETRAGDPFPGTSNKREFTDATSPGMKTWNGVSLNKPITDITEQAPSGVITFKVSGGTTPLSAPTAQAATSVTPRSFVASWSEVPMATNYMLSVYTIDESGNPNYALGYDHRSVGTSTAVTVRGLDPSTAYIYNVIATNDGHTGNPSNEIAVNTAALTHDYVIPVSLAPTRVRENSFTANWEAVDDGTDDYLLTVTERRLYDAVTITEGFDGSCTDWFATSSNFYRNSNYSVSAPGLGLDHGQFICSPIVTSDIRSVSFFNRANKANDKCLILVDALKGVVWEPVATLTTSKAKRTTHLYDIPEGCKSVRITAVDPTGTTTVYVDDIAVTYGGTLRQRTLDGFNEKSVGNVTSFEVTDCDGGTDYLYTVKAVKGGVKSLSSMSQYLHTYGESGIASAVADASAVKVSVDGGTVVISAKAGEPVFVSDASGKVLFAGEARNGELRIDAPHAGVVLVRAGATVTKVVVP